MQVAIFTIHSLVIIGKGAFYTAPCVERERGRVRVAALGGGLSTVGLYLEH